MLAFPPGVDRTPIGGWLLSNGSPEGRVRTDPSRTLRLLLDFQSVHIAVFRMRYRMPDDDWVVFAHGTERDDEREYDLPALPWGTLVEHRFLYSSRFDDAFRVALAFAQDGEPLEGSPLVVSGPGTGIAVEGRVELVEHLEEVEP
jgi:hypothetical protein